MTEFTEWQIFLLSAIIGFFVALGCKYATVSKLWNDKRAVTSAIISNAVLGAIFGAVTCGVAKISGMVITDEHITIFCYILIAVASGETIAKLLEKKIGQAIRIWLGFADADEKDKIIAELREANKEANDKLNKLTGDTPPDEVSIDLPPRYDYPSPEPKPEPPTIDPLATAIDSSPASDVTTMNGDEGDIETI